MAIDESGEREFSFARKPGADTQLTKEELDQRLLSDCRIFHFGSLSLTDEPARETTMEAAAIAKRAGAVISYDPNYRASLWKDEKTAVEGMKSAIPLADVKMCIRDRHFSIFDTAAKLLHFQAIIVRYLHCFYFVLSIKYMNTIGQFSRYIKSEYF